MSRIIQPRPKKVWCNRCQSREVMSGGENSICRECFTEMTVDSLQTLAQRVTESPRPNDSGQVLTGSPNRISFSNTHDPSEELPPYDPRAVHFEDF